MDAKMIVPTFEAGLQVAQLLMSSYALYQQGHMTPEQLAGVWATVGIGVKSANARWEAAGAAQPVRAS